jgi:uncharacterized membrane protein YhaH (DUF805 family)
MDNSNLNGSLSHFDQVVGQAGRKPKDRMSIWDYFMEAITDNYFDFHGRARRKEYWSFYLFFLFIFLFFLANLLNNFLSTHFDYEEYNMASVFVIGIMILLLFFFFIPSFSITFRRLHDIGVSGWALLLNLLPFGGLILLVMSLIPSNKGSNHYGSSPR